MGSSGLMCCFSLLCAARNVLALFRGVLAVIPTPLCISLSALDDCFNPTFALKPSLVTPLAEKPLPLLQQKHSAEQTVKGAANIWLEPCPQSLCQRVPLAVGSVTPAMPLPLNNGNAAAGITGSSAAVGESQQADACLLCNPWHAKRSSWFVFQKKRKKRCINLKALCYLRPYIMYQKQA